VDGTCSDMCPMTLFVTNGFEYLGYVRSGLVGWLVG
jgi:hypothetical protein